MIYTLRMTLPDNHTTRSDELVTLINPDTAELRVKLRSMLARGEVTMIVSEDGTDKFYTHDRVCLFYLFLH